MSACCSAAAFKLPIEPALGLLFQRAAGGIGVEQKGVQHHVVVGMPQLTPVRSSVSSAALLSRMTLGTSGVFEQRLELIDERQRHRTAFTNACTRGRGNEFAGSKRDGERRIRRARRQPFTDLVRGAERGIIARMAIVLGGQLAQQAGELQLLIDLLQRADVGRLDSQFL